MTHVVILPHVIEQKLKENERQEVIDFVNALVDDTSGELKRDVIEIIGEKFERKLSVEIVNLKADLIERIANSETKLTERTANLETKLTDKIANLEAKLTEKIANNKAEMIKWMFIFWIGSVITTIGGIAAILKIAQVF